MEQQINRIKEKLARIQKQGWQKYKGNFGVEYHRFHVNPPIAEQDIARFETQHCIQLPADYRTFLLEVGNGGAGPYCGLYPLELWDRAAYEKPENLPPDYLSQPCPLHPGLSRESGWDAQLGCAWEELYQGTIAICNQGCSYYGLLIVSGAWRGRVCNVDADGQAPHFVSDGDFLSWYERWLDETLSGKEIWWFGFDEAAKR